VANDFPGAQPFSGNCTASATTTKHGSGEIGPVPPHKRLVVETVSAMLTTGAYGRVHGMSLCGPSFTLYLVPTLTNDGAYDLRQYYATHAVRFYVESGDSLQFLVNTVGGGGEATCWISGYFLDT
jgi:hypothetical protein